MRVPLSLRFSSVLDDGLAIGASFIFAGQTAQDADGEAEDGQADAKAGIVVLE